MKLKQRDIILMVLLTRIMFLSLDIDILQAEEFHVTTAAEFQNALTTARDNGEADTIWLAAGTYNASDNNYAFTYIAKDGEDYDLTIKGEAGTTAEDVIIDGNGEYEVLSIEQGSAPVTIEAITASNGIQGISISSSGDITLINNIITGNIEDFGPGGGVYAYTYSSSDITLINNIITSNTAAARGGGVYILSGDTILINNIITGNTAWDGGGVCINSYLVTLINNIITGNIAEGFFTTLGDGGGVYIDSYHPSVVITLTNNTIAENKASKGGGLYLECPEEDIIANIYNNIIWGNGGEEGNDIYYEGHIYAIAYVYNNNFHDKAGSPFTEDIDNINVDPMFVNPELEDYHLRFGSPCINKGTADAPELPSTDFEGDSRIIGSAPDIGADEFDPSAPPTTTTIPITTTIALTSTTTIFSTTTTTADSSTTTTTPSSCLSLRLYGEHSEETELLRYIRDNILSQTKEGKEIIRLYYQWSPDIVQAMENDEEFREELKEMIDEVLTLLK